MPEHYQKENKVKPSSQSTYPGSAVLSIFSIFTTPFILFISTSNTLYLKNQEDLGYQLHVLYPFLIIFLLTAVCGGIFYLLYKTFSKSFFRIFLWAYFLLGPFFLILNSLNSGFDDLSNWPVLRVVFLLIYCVAVLWLHAKGNIRVAESILGSVFIAILAFEGYTFYNGYETNSLPESASVNISKSAKGRSEGPNIYHIVFDEFQTDMFARTLSPEIMKELEGFVFFPENTTLFGRTRMSLASTFIGKPYDYERSQIEYQMAGYNSEESFLHPLVEQGYETHAIIHSIVKFDQRLFHQKIYHNDFAVIAFLFDTTGLFLDMWLFAYLPRCISKKFIQEEGFNQFENQNFLPDIAPIISYSSFRRYLSLEKDLPGSGRYVFMHLILPHFPDVLRSDCTFARPTTGAKIPSTSPLEQSKCATKMIIDLARELKKLNRFEDSLILVHGDHGSRYKVENNELVNIQKYGYYSSEWSRARSRALMVIKFPSKKMPLKSFTISNSETTLLDIAPTVLDAVDIAPIDGFEGVSLVDFSYGLSLKRDKRYYHFYNKKGWHGWTDKMIRYLIRGNTITKEKVIRLNDPRPHKDRPIEFPWENGS
jgi:hypothetical protein